MRGDGFQSRQVFRIEAFAGDRKLDAYVIPGKPTRRASVPLSRYDRLEPRPVPGQAYSMDGVEIFVGVDLGAEEDLTANTRDQILAAVVKAFGIPPEILK